MENFKICLSEKTKEEVKTDWGLGNANFLNVIFIFIIRLTTFLSFKMSIKSGLFFAFRPTVYYNFVHIYVFHVYKTLPDSTEIEYHENK